MGNVDSIFGKPTSWSMDGSSPESFPTFLLAPAERQGMLGSSCGVLTKMPEVHLSDGYG